MNHLQVQEIFLKDNKAMGETCKKILKLVIPITNHHQDQGITRLIIFQYYANMLRSFLSMFLIYATKWETQL